MGLRVDFLLISHNQTRKAINLSILKKLTRKINSSLSKKNSIMDKKLSKKPLVSVVIPYYNHKLYIEKCINSIAEQTYENLEVIIIDDCSPDGSGEYVGQMIKNKNWVKRFSDKIYFTHFQKNQGAHAAINYGINKAHGEVIAVVNSDDTYHPERIQVMVECMQKEQKEFAFSQVGYIDDNEEDIGESDDWAQAYTQIQEKIEELPTLGFVALTGNPGISTGNFVFTKNVYQCTLGFRNIRYCHDWDFLLQCVFYTEPLFVQEKLYYYRIHDTNTFKSLQEEGVHIDDTNYVLQNYFDSVRCRKTVNPLAPSPFNWPGYFELFLKLNNYEEHYKKSVYVNT
ncbi:MAG: glycosyltransferase family 2 protein [Gomphosphaeria aponina SAG 52.96 = DSM 107014]|uniref:Glycosyltransferase family 2 protein n=1 Tax=Gomphosphaeria aponina SAG 52.96 = DSM 107014 TaxID=1521640 RepID=A0A941GTW5_9CHRO|nr:glycosyltransferase family 2 protein [Gomphosphaeria aponina SAG 52.96 = DSM 107014]